MKVVPVKPEIFNFEILSSRDSDEAWKEVVYSARVSGIPQDFPDEEVFKMMVKNDYGSALEHIIIKFDIKMSKGNAPELLEHRISSHTGYSTRFVKVDNRYTDDYERYEVIIPWDLLHILGHKEDLSKATEEELESIGFGFINSVPNAISEYERLLEDDVPRESARYVLPFCQAVGIYHMTWNLRSLINFLSLRLCVRSSPEMRSLASQIYFELIEQLPIMRKLIGCRGFMRGVCPEDNVTGVRVGKQHPVYPKCPFVENKTNTLTNTFIPTKYEVEKRLESEVFNTDEAVSKMEKLFKRWAVWEE